MTRRLPLLAALLATLASAPLHAQDSAFVVRHSPAVVKYGKWTLAVSALGMGLQASSRHNAADRAFGQLEAYCLADKTRCDTGPGGGYADPVAEGYYQSSLSFDRSARRWLLGGETTLLASAALFVWELTRPQGHPKNIPFEPEFQVTGYGTRMGLRVAF
jgi:hypothetical protein